MAPENFETTCPQCGTDFDVAADADSAQCPNCKAVLQFIPPASPKKSGKGKPAKVPAIAAPSARDRFLQRQERTPAPNAGRHVIDLEGVGPVYAKKLGAKGVETTEQLLAADAKKLAKGTKIAYPEIRRWQDMAELLHLEAIGPHVAQVLVRADINSVAELARQEPAALLKRIKVLGDAGKVSGRAVSRKDTTAWIAEAVAVAPPPPDPGQIALRKVGNRAEPEPAEGEEPAPPADATDLDPRKMAEEAKHEAERGFLRRFGRSVAKPTVEVAQSEPMPTKPSLFNRGKRDDSSAGKAAKEAEKTQRLEARQAERILAAETRLREKAAKKALQEAAATAKDAERVQKEQARVAAKEAAARAKNESKSAQVESVSPTITKGKKQAAAPAAQQPEAGEPVTCAHCNHSFTVPTGTRQASCPKCKSLLAFYSEGEDAPIAPPNAKLAAAAQKEAQRQAKAQAKELEQAKRAEAKLASRETKAELSSTKSAALAGVEADAKAVAKQQAIEEKARLKQEAAARREAEAKAKQAEKAARLELEAAKKAELAAAKAAKQQAAKDAKKKAAEAKQIAREEGRAAKLAATETKQAPAVAVEPVVEAKPRKGAKSGKTAKTIEPVAEPAAVSEDQSKADAKLAKRQAKEAAAQVKLAANQERKAAKEKAKQEKLEAKRLAAEAKTAAKAAKADKPAKQDEPSNAAIDGKQQARVAAQEARSQARRDKQAAVEAERRARELAKRRAIEAQAAGIEGAGLWEQSVAQPLSHAVKNGVFEATVEARRAEFEQAEDKQARKALAKGKLRLIDGHSSFAVLPEDKVKPEKPRLPDGQSPFVRLPEDEHHALPKPRLPDGRSPFVKLPEDERSDAERVFAFGHLPGSEYTTKGGFHITEELVATEAPQQIELGTRADRAKARDDERAKRAEERKAAKEAKRLSVETARAAAERRKLEAKEQARRDRESKQTTVPAPASEIAPAAKESARKRKAAVDPTSQAEPTPEPTPSLLSRFGRKSQATEAQQEIASPAEKVKRKRGSKTVAVEPVIAPVPEPKPSLLSRFSRKSGAVAKAEPEEAETVAAASAKAEAKQAKADEAARKAAEREAAKVEAKALKAAELAQRAEAKAAKEAEKIAAQEGPAETAETVIAGKSTKGLFSLFKSEPVKTDETPQGAAPEQAAKAGLLGRFKGKRPAEPEPVVEIAETPAPRAKKGKSAKAVEIVTEAEPEVQGSATTLQAEADAVKAAKLQEKADLAAQKLALKEQQRLLKEEARVASEAERARLAAAKKEAAQAKAAQDEAQRQARARQAQQEATAREAALAEERQRKEADSQARVAAKAAATQARLALKEAETRAALERKEREIADRAAAKLAKAEAAPRQVAAEDVERVVPAQIAPIAPPRQYNDAWEPPAAQVQKAQRAQTPVAPPVVRALPPTPAKPEPVRMVPVQRVVEHTVVRNVAYDPRAIDALLKQHAAAKAKKGK